MGVAIVIYSVDIQQDEKSELAEADQDCAALKLVVASQGTEFCLFCQRDSCQRQPHGSWNGRLCDAPVRQALGPVVLWLVIGDAGLSFAHNWTLQALGYC